MNNLTDHILFPLDDEPEEKWTKEDEADLNYSQKKLDNEYRD